jgi:lysophospholipase L1-like esterase
MRRHAADRPRPKLRLRARLAALLGGTLVFLLLLELLLRLAAWGLERTLPRRAAPETRRAILCVGDSFTYGLGAPAGQDYPSQLERLIEERHPDAGIVVVNRGRPGFTSSEVLQRLESDLQEMMPLAVVLLVGMNNLWKPALTRPREQDLRPSLSHRLYTVKLFHLLAYRLERYLAARRATPAGNPGSAETTPTAVPGRTATPAASLRETLEQGLARFPRRIDQLLALARLEREEGRPPRAEELLDRCLEADPHAVECRGERARLLFETGRPEEALGDCARYLEERPYAIPFWQLRALTLFRLGRAEQAWGLLEAAGEEGISDAGLARMFRAPGGRSSGPPSEPDPLFERLRDTTAFRLRGLLQGDGPVTPEAVQLWLADRSAAEREDDRLLLGAPLQLFADQESLVHRIPRLTQLAEGSVVGEPLRKILGLLCAAIGDRLEACGQPGITPAPGSLLALAAELLRPMAADEALRRDALFARWEERTGREHPWLRLQMIDALDRLENWPALLPLVERELERFPEMLCLHKARWRALTALRRCEEAEEEAMRVEPYLEHEPEFWTLRAWLAVQCGAEFDRAYQLYTTALARQPDSAYLLGETAWTAFKSGRTTEALELLRRFLEKPHREGQLEERLAIEYAALSLDVPEISELFARHGYGALAHTRPPSRRQESLLADVRAMARLLSERGIPLLVLEYPVRPEGLPTLEDYAAIPGVTPLPVRERFAAAIRGSDRSRFFAPDGHCTAEGYAILARIVLEGLEPLLGAR